jgi:FKBP-type peptidyl-prolyl cis-trans isomerase FklB
MKLLMSISLLFVLHTQVNAQAARKPAGVAKPAAKSVAKKPAEAQPALKSSLDSFSYALGVSMASFYKDQGVKSFNTSLVTKALNDVKNGKVLLTEEQCNNTLMSYIQAAKSEAAASTKKEGAAFLATNKTRPGVVTTASGLQYTVLKEGSGPKPTATDQVKVHYHGTLLDGTIFDSSIQRGEPIVLGVGNVIAGWIEALQLMPVGSKWKLFIPSDLAYGDNAQPGSPIKPGSTLIFDVELIDIVK